MSIHDHNYRTPQGSSSSSSYPSNTAIRLNNRLPIAAVTNTAEDPIERLKASKRQFDQKLTGLCHQLAQMVNDIESLRQFNDQLYRASLNQIKLQQQQQQNQQATTTPSPTIQSPTVQQSSINQSEASSSSSSSTSSSSSSNSSRSSSPRRESTQSVTSNQSEMSTHSTTSSMSMIIADEEIDQLDVDDIDQLPLYQLDYFINFLYEAAVNGTSANKQADFLEQFERLCALECSSSNIVVSSPVITSKSSTTSESSQNSGSSDAELSGDSQEEEEEQEDVADEEAEMMDCVYEIPEPTEVVKPKFEFHYAKSVSMEMKFVDALPEQPQPQPSLPEEPEPDETVDVRINARIEEEVVFIDQQEYESDSSSSSSSSSSSEEEEEADSSSPSVYEDSLNVSYFTAVEDKGVVVSDGDAEEEEEDMDIDVAIPESKVPIIEGGLLLKKSPIDVKGLNLTSSPTNSSSAVSSASTSPSSAKDIISPTDIANNNNHSPISPISRVIGSLKNRSSSFNSSTSSTTLSTTPEEESPKLKVFEPRKTVDIKSYDEKTGKETFERVVLKPVRRAETFASPRDRPTLTIAAAAENGKTPEDTENLSFANRRNMWERRSLGRGYKFRATQQSS